MLSQAQIQNQLAELSADGGGSLVTEVHKSEIHPSTRLLFVGLGGMGCKTINAIKEIYQRQYNQTDASSRVRFLAVDTSQGDLDELLETNKKTNGCMTQNETFPIYDSDAMHLLVHRPPVVEQWLTKDIETERLNPDGAKQVRAIGRVMLCGTEKYQALRSRVTDEIDALRNNATPGDIISVVLVAGISGGTGSGTFIDVSYLIRKVLDRFAEDEFVSSQFFGVFYTPDVQKSIPDIGKDKSIWSNLQRNGYAAMKELDYFVSNGDIGAGSDVIYSLDLPGGERVESTAQIFEPKKVFLVSTSPNNSECFSIISSTAASLLNMFRVGETPKEGQPGSAQSVISALSNKTTVLSTWGAQNIGQQANKQLPEDECGIHNTEFPAFMNYAYSSFGYRTIYFPRNEMAAFCANSAFEGVYNLWSRAFKWTDEDIRKHAASCGIGSVDAIYQAMLKILNFSRDDFRMSAEDAPLQMHTGVWVIGQKYSGMNETIAAARNRAVQKLNAAKAAYNMNDQAGRYKMVGQLVNLVKAHITSEKFWAEYGPFGACTLLVGKSGDESHAVNSNGMVGLIDNMISTLSVTQEKRQEALKKAANKMNNEATRLASDHSVETAEVETFLNYCAEYTEAVFVDSFFREPSLMTQILMDLRSMLIRYNNETFDTFVPVIHCLKDLLSTDSAAFMKGTLEQKGYKTTYSLDAFHVDQARAMNQQFINLFKGYVDGRMRKELVQKIQTSFFGANSAETWKAYRTSTDNPVMAHKLAEEIRKVFKHIVEPVVTDMLEKFVVLAYADPNELQNLVGKGNPVTIQTLRDSIWTQDTLRDQALNSAADKIVNSLSDSLMIAFSIPATAQRRFSRAVSVVLLKETPLLNEAIQRKLKEKYNERYSCVVLNDDACRTEISMTMSISPFALAQVRFMDQFAREYFASEKQQGAAAGRHLDEVTEKWQIFLPEIYGVDAEEYFVDMCHMPNMAIPDASRAAGPNGPKNNDREVYELLREAIEYGLQKKFIGHEDGHHYIIVLNNRSDAFLARLEETALSMKVPEGAPAPTWVDALYALEAKDNKRGKYARRVFFKDTPKIDGLESREMLVPDDPSELKNLYRLVRANMNSERLVLDERQFYASTGIIEKIERLTTLTGVVKLFVHAWKLGWITCENHVWKCKYSNNAYNPPLEFFRDHLKMNPKFDEFFRWYLVISGFSKLYASDVLRSNVEQKFAEERGGGQPMFCFTRVLTELQQALNLPLLTTTDTEVRDTEVGRYLEYSLYKDYFNYPIESTNSAALISNVTRIVAVLDELHEHEGTGEKDPAPSLFGEEPPAPAEPKA